MKIYVFNHKENWETRGAVAIVAENQAQAEKWYQERFQLGLDDYTVVEKEIAVGLVLEADGYDNVKMLVHQL